MSANDTRVLVIEDEPPIRRFLRASLNANGYDVIEADTAQGGMREAATQQPDLVVLDLGLPDHDGLEVIRRVREWSSVPIIVLSARGQEADKVAALDAGADDYLTKPFGVGELLARLRVSLRHGNRRGDATENPEFVVRNLRVDFVRRLVFLDDQELRLTPIEYRLISTLIKHAGKVVSHQQLLKEVWGPHATKQTQYLRVYMGHLRHKIEADPARPQILLTEAGVGYRLAAE
ncbi:response regulator [Paludisphaera borealis]|uniref:KDP operon transcriptional regulatory protein KdpE n=1 Tax=Paludisphaera borealis TaxID=1387353 RepID=A0A1U7CTJ8_9BACT|nr:response regulator [Paludisphaera borealis]APW62252.1 KDP operon transcriptional regulatory protein KdpE [Paludisphaera borealis]